MHSILFGQPDLSKFPPDVKFVNKFMALFPIFSEGAENSSLNVIDYKYLMLYSDHLSVFKSVSQNEPPSDINMDK